jgi:7-cyano-7-deazaguanine synthase in queuosine biosynthesis
MKGWSLYAAISVFIVGLIVYSIQYVWNKPELIVYHEPVYNVFWTGGYDSTFLVLYLLKFGNVQPIYLQGCIDNETCDKKDRRSQYQEEKTMDTIRQLINSKYTLLPTKKINNILLDEDTRKAAQESYKSGVGTRSINQYAFISQYCKDNNIIAYVGVVYSDGNWSNFPVINKGTTRCRNTTLKLFKNFRFPCIHLSKKDMKYLLKNDELLNKTWSCWRPQNGVPCGKCSMCKHRII